MFTFIVELDWYDENGCSRCDKIIVNAYDGDEALRIATRQVAALCIWRHHISQLLC
jgi:hypothetical protein